MPKVFKGRRNILRSPNKSKREHFTQQTDPLDTDISDLTDKMVKYNNEKKIYDDNIDINPLWDGAAGQVAAAAALKEMKAQLPDILELENKIAGAAATEAKTATNAANADASTAKSANNATKSANATTNTTDTTKNCSKKSCTSC